jgi:hypothetical protein
MQTSVQDPGLWDLRVSPTRYSLSYPCLHTYEYVKDLAYVETTCLVRPESEFRRGHEEEPILRGVICSLVTLYRHVRRVAY